jgi:AraC-like DNA-binding protein
MMPGQPYTFLCRTPAFPLSLYVDKLWYSARDGGRAGFERVLPTGAVQVVIRLDQDPILRFDAACQNATRFEHAVVSGAGSRPYVKATYPRARVLGVSFHPAGASGFCREFQNELKDRHVPAEVLWGGWLRELQDRLRHTNSPSAMFALVERALLSRLRDPSASWRTIRWAVDRFVAAPSSARVGEITDATGYSRKQFIRLFERHVGLTPKVFCRVLRFQSVLTRLDSPTLDWAKIALDCGYYDQPHLIRDFRQFADTPPSRYRPAEPSRRNHVTIEPSRLVKGARP